MRVPNEPWNQEINVIDVIQKIVLACEVLWKERMVIIKRMVIAGIAGTIFAFGSPVEYSARMRLLPYRNGGGGSLPGLASLAGIRLPTAANDQIITTDLYPEVAKSLSFRESVAETPIRFSSLNRTISSTEYFRRIRRVPLAEKITSYPFKFFQLRNSNVIKGKSSRELLSSNISPTDSEATTVRQFDQPYLSLIENIGQRVSISIDKKTSIIVVSAKMPDPYASADLVRVSSERLMQRIIEYESQKAKETFGFVNEQYREAKLRYEDSQRRLAIFTDRNRTLMGATLQIERDRLQRENEIAFEIYQQFSRELEQARIKMKQDTPVFTVLDEAVVPNTRASPVRTKVMLFSIILGLIVGIANIWAKKTFPKNNDTVTTS